MTRRALIAGGGVTAAVLIADRLRPKDQVAPAVGDTTLWRQGIPMNHAHSETPAVVIDGRIYIGGGFEAESRLDRFDPATNSWEQLPDLPVAVHHAGLATLNGKLYLAGGYTTNGSKATDSCWIFDPVEQGWESIAPLPQPKGAFGFVATADALYAVGGAYDGLGGKASTDLLRYDVQQDRWDSLTPLPTGREHLAAAVVSDAIYAIGGRADGNESRSYGSVNERYDIANGTWARATPLPVDRSGLAAVSTSDSVIVLGGERERTLFGNVNRFTASTELWDELPSMPTPRHGTAAAILGNDLFAIGGSTLAGRVQNTPVVEILDLSKVSTGGS